jgi:preprotein translocase subunit SecE
MTADITTPTAPAIEELAALVTRLGEVTAQITDEELGAEVSDEQIADVLYAAARLFSAKTDRVGKIAWPIAADALNATETVVLVTALLDAADINLFDMAIWYRRAE